METPGKYKTSNKEPSLDDIVDRLDADVQLLKQNADPTFEDVYEILCRITGNCTKIALEILPHLENKQTNYENSHD